MARIKLTLEYDGAAYVGWQVQKNGISIQEKVQEGLRELLGKEVSVEGGARTDAGVHALGQVACFDTERDLPLKAYRQGLNGLLPQDIAVVFAEVVDGSFDPRRWAVGKRYRYLISNLSRRAPLRRRTHWEIFQPLDLASMQEAAGHLLGRHDFSAFRAADCEAAHAVRELRELRLSGHARDEIQIHAEGTAFLKHMVRNIAGTLVDVGKGRQPAGWVKDVLLGRDRRAAGPTAPAHGLTLIELSYGQGPRTGEG